MTLSWHKIADTPTDFHFPASNLIEIEAGGRRICLARHNGSLFACANKCPHAGGTLAEGYLDNSGNIVCPVHRYKFSLDNGRNTSGEGYFLKTFPIEVRPDGVYVGITGGSLFGWLK